MKIALYIEDGLDQIVLTPESKTEESILGKLHDGSRELSIHRGEFYPCRGGWVRHKSRYSGLYGVTESDNDDKSTMIVLREQPKPDDRVEMSGDGRIMAMAEIAEAGL